MWAGALMEETTVLHIERQLNHMCIYATCEESFHSPLVLHILYMAWLQARV